jgi:hypothetical protein
MKVFGGVVAYVDVVNAKYAVFEIVQSIWVLYISNNMHRMQGIITYRNRTFRKVDFPEPLRP